MTVRVVLDEYEENGRDERLGTFNWSSVPRKDELIALKGHVWRVFSLIWFASGTPTVQMRLTRVSRATEHAPD